MNLIIKYPWSVLGWNFLKILSLNGLKKPLDAIGPDDVIFSVVLITFLNCSFESAIKLIVLAFNGIVDFNLALDLTFLAWTKSIGDVFFFQ